MKYTSLLHTFVRCATFLCAAVLLLGFDARAAGAGRAPTIYAFNHTGAATINLGEKVGFSWSVGDATEVSLSPDIGVVTGSWIELTPTQTTTYTLTARNVNGTATKSRVITVVAPPVVTSFTGTPAAIVAGASARLDWTAPGATSYNIVADVGSGPGQLFTTTTTVRPMVTTTYTITARNSAGTGTRSVTIPVTAPPPKPTIVSFTAAPASVVAGQAAMLNWSVDGATSLSISPGIGAVTGSSVSVTPTTTTAYTLTATNPSGSVTKRVTVTVTPPPPLPTIAAFSASPTSIALGASSTLTWSVSGAASLELTSDGGPSPGVVTGTGLSVSPAVSTVYTLRARNSAGASVTRTVAITVNDAGPLPIIAAFTAEPGSIAPGASTTLNWSVTGAANLSIVASVGSSPGAITGTSVSVTPSVTTTYTLTATNTNGGSVTRTVQVTILAPAPVISALTASPASILAGASSTLSWSVTGAETLSLSADVAANPGRVTGTSHDVTPGATTVYTLTATNAAGVSTTRSVTVTVTTPPPASGIVIDSLTATPMRVIAGEPVTLRWVVRGADSLWMSANFGGDVGSMNGRTSVVVTPAATTRYVLTAFSSQHGTVTKAVTVEVGPPPPLPVPVITSFGASPSTIAIGHSTTLNWNVIDADQISIAANIGASPGIVTGTSIGISPTENTTYTLSATNIHGTVTRTANVVVTGPTAPVIGSFIASPAFIPPGGNSTLRWSVSGADSISIAADVGVSPGTVTGTSFGVTPSATTTYTLTATNTIGRTTATVPVTIYTPGTGSVAHPRIWLTPQSLPALRARAAANDPAWVRLRTQCDQYVQMPIRWPDEAPASNTINGGYQYLDYLQPATALGLAYQIAKTVDPTRAAAYAAKEKQLLLILSDPVRHGRPTTDSGYSIRAYVPALALGFDWIYETLDDAERAQIFTEINRWVASYEATGFGRDFPQGNYFAGYYCGKALGALATEGDNPNAAAMWNDWLNRVHYGMAQPYHAQWLSGGGAPDGWNYGPFELINMARPIAAAFTAKGLDLIHDTRPFTYLDGHANWMAHFTWPDMKTVSDRGFVYESNNPTPTSAGWATQYTGLLRLANGSNTPLMQRYTNELRSTAGSGDRAEAWADFLFYDATAPSEDFRTSLSYRTHGDGQVAMRSSWASNAVWASFQSGPYTGYHASSEEFYDKGSLAIQRGSVQFLVNAWGAMMRHTPGTEDGWRIFDPLYTELFGDQTDGVHGGRRIFNTYYAVRAQGYWGQIGNGPGHARTTLSHFEDTGRHVFTRGTHIEDQYWAPHPINGWTRSVVYVRPEVFVVYDRTSVTNASVDNWMAWHVSAQPTEQAGAAPGTRRFDVVDTRPNFGGNLFRGRVTTVLPANNNVTSIDLFGKAKVYRLEVRKPAPSVAATWLTVFDAAASAASASSVTPLTLSSGNVVAGAVEGALVSGANGSNSAVFFSQTGANIAGDVRVAVPAAATYFVVTDLRPNGGYGVHVDVIAGQLRVDVVPDGALRASPQGTLSFTVSATGVVNETGGGANAP